MLSESHSNAAVTRRGTRAPSRVRLACAGAPAPPLKEGESYFATAPKCLVELAFARTQDHMTLDKTSAV